MKKKRSAKQLANDRRLGRMAKERAAARKKAGTKVTRRNANPKRRALKKDHLWVVFNYNRNANSVSFLGPTGQFSSNKGAAVRFTTKGAANIALNRDYKPGKFLQYGIAPDNYTPAKIRDGVMQRHTSAGK